MWKLAKRRHGCSLAISLPETAIKRLVLCLMSVLLLAAGAAHAAEKAKRKAVPGPKPSFDLSMQVVIVRSSAKGCEPMCTEWIMAEGMITAETPKALQQALSQGQGAKQP